MVRRLQSAGTPLHAYLVQCGPVISFVLSFKRAAGFRRPQRGRDAGSPRLRAWAASFPRRERGPAPPRSPSSGRTAAAHPARLSHAAIPPSAEARADELTARTLAARADPPAHRPPLHAPPAGRPPPKTRGPARSPLHRADAPVHARPRARFPGRVTSRTRLAHPGRPPSPQPRALTAPQRLRSSGARARPGAGAWGPTGTSAVNGPL